ncbi:MAG: hypothetical protein QXX55_01145 [Candidatus Pacearchaeota archaeon]
MNRRTFLKKFGMGAGMTLLFSPIMINSIHNESPYSKEELVKEQLSLTNMNELEKAIMVGSIITYDNTIPLINLHKEIIKKTTVFDEIKKIEEEIFSYVLKKSRDFSKKRAKNDELNETVRIINEKYGQIKKIKEKIEISLLNFKRETFVSFDDYFIIPTNYIHGELSLKLTKSLSILDSSITKYKEQNSRINRVYATLVNLSPISHIIREASEISGVPVEDIIALSDIESLGMNLVGAEGEINTHQLHPKYLKQNYRNALSIKNPLSDYIRENTSENSLLEDLVKDEKLNISLVVNLMKFHRENTKEYYEYILAHNIGLKRTQNLRKHTRIKLKNPELITQQEKKNNSIFRYYTNFISSREAFRQIKDYLCKEYFYNPKS